MTGLTDTAREVARILCILGWHRWETVEKGSLVWSGTYHDCYLAHQKCVRADCNATRKAKVMM